MDCTTVSVPRLCSLAAMGIVSPSRGPAMAVQIGSILIRTHRLIPFNIKSAIMIQKADSLEKQYANKTGQYGPHDRSGDGLRMSERSVGARTDAPARSQPMPLEACLDCAATYDLDVNYAIVLASLIIWIATRDAKRTGRQARPTS